MGTVNKYQNNFTTGVLSPGVYARVDLQKYSAGCKRIVNGIVHAHGGISKRPGSYLVDTIPGDGILFPFTYSVTQTYALLFYDDGTTYAKMRIYKDGGVVVNGGTAVVINTPFLPSELKKIKFTQSADVMFLVHPSHKPMKLTRSSHTTWTFEEITFMPTIETPTGLTATASGFTDTSGTHTATREILYKVAAVNDRESESLPSTSAKATQSGSTQILVYWPEGAKIVLDWTAVEGAVRYEVYKNTAGYYAWLGSAESTTFTDNNIEGDSKMGPKENRNPFDAADEYPGAVGIYQQRLIFGRTNKEPHTVWLSETGSFDSMAVSYPIRDDNAITATVDSKQMNEIRHFVSLRDVLMMTSGAEFQLSAGKNNDAVTPTTITFNLQSYWGCSEVPPIVSGRNIVFAENSGKIIRDLQYKLTDDGYTGEEVSILAEHLLDSPVRDWAYQQSPWSTIWICLESGKLLTFTYKREQEIWAWSEHESSGGKFLSVTSIREGEKDSVYFLVKRGGNYLIEYQKRREYGDPVEDSFFVDSGLSYSGTTAISHVTGLTHLSGEKVVALADGSVVRGLTVAADGSVDLPTAANKISIGLGYSLLVETMDPEMKSQNGTMTGLKKNVPCVTFTVRETRGLKAGPSEDRLTEFKFPMPLNWGDPPVLYSGVVKATIPGESRYEASIVFKQDEPLPATVLGVETTVSAG